MKEIEKLPALATESEPDQSTVPSRRELGAFTKEHSPEERKAAAQEIRAVRADYFKRQKELADQIAALSVEKLTDEEKIGGGTREIGDLEGEIQSIQDSLIRSIIDHSKLKRLQVELGVEQHDETEIENDYAALVERLQEINEQKNDKAQLVKAREILDRFYGKSSEKWEEFKEEESSREIENIVKKYDVVFVHAINANYVPTLNSPLNSEADWKTKLRIALAMEPTLSCSTIKAGDHNERMWAGMGLILKKGRVVDASAVDANTRARGLKQRTGVTTNQGSSKISEKIESAIDHVGAPNARYNELVVEDGEPAGFYYCEDGVDNFVRGDLADAKEIAAEVSRLGLPLYVIRLGHVFAAHYDAEKNKIMHDTDLFKPKDLVQGSYELSNEQKEQIEKEILEDSPFKLKTEEPQYLDARANGVDTYMKLNVAKGFRNLEDGAEAMDVQEGAYQNDILDNSRVRIVARSYGAHAKAEYVVQEKTGKLFEIRKKKDAPNGRRQMVDYTQVDSVDGFKPYDTSITVGYYMEGMGHSLLANEDYLGGVEAVLAKLKREEDALVEESYAGQKHHYTFRREMLAFHLFGFAEVAGQNQDVESQKRALKIAEQILPQEKYGELVKRRIGPHGEFRMTKDDLQNVGV